MKTKNYLKNGLFYAMIIVIIPLLIKGEIILSLCLLTILISTFSDSFIKSWDRYHEMKNRCKEVLKRNSIYESMFLEIVKTRINLESCMEVVKEKDDLESAYKKHIAQKDDIESAAAEVLKKALATIKLGIYHYYVEYKNEDLLFYYHPSRGIRKEWKMAKTEKNLQQLGKEIDENINIIETNLKTETAK